MGNFIVIDSHSNATVAAGMIRRGVVASEAHRPALVLFNAKSPLIGTLEQELLASGAEVVRTAVTGEKTLHGLLALGLIVLVEGALTQTTLASLAEFTTLDAADSSSPAEIAARLLQPQKESLR